MGFFLELVVVASGDTSHPVLCFFGLIVSIWAISMLQYWKRAQSWQAMKWGMIGFEQSEPMRPEFYGVPMYSPVDGKRVIFFPEKIAASRLQKSAVVVVSFVSFVVGVVASIYVLKFQLTAMFGTSLAGIVAGVANTVQITLLNWAYQHIAIKMTDNENKRTDTEYADSLISKLFIFQFINSFSSFFFLGASSCLLPPASLFASRFEYSSSLTHAQTPQPPHTHTHSLCCAVHAEAGRREAERARPVRWSHVYDPFGSQLGHRLRHAHDGQQRDGVLQHAQRVEGSRGGRD